jgi:hypothetical protein
LQREKGGGEVIGIGVVKGVRKREKKKKEKRKEKKKRKRKKILCGEGYRGGKKRFFILFF